MKNTDDLNNQLVARLEEITQRGISKADMARIAGVTPQAVNGWLPEAEQERMIDTFALRLKEIDDYVEKYLRGRFKANDVN